MFKKISLVISVLSLIVSLTQFVYAQEEDKKIPEDFDKRWNRAAELMEKGEYKEAISTYMILISALEKGEVRGACWYNVSCAYMKLKDEKSALISVGYAIKDGFRKLDQFQSDKDLKPLNDTDLFKHFMKLLKENDAKTLDNLDVMKLVNELYKKPEKDDKSEQMQEILERLQKYIDTKLKDLKDEAYRDFEKLLEELRKNDFKIPETEKDKYQAYLGIIVEEITENTRMFFRIPKNQGVVINSVTVGSPAEKAGLTVLDIILECDGKIISNPEQIKELVKNSDIESTLSMLILRDSKRKTINVKLGKKLKKTPETTNKLNALKHGYLGVKVNQIEGGLEVQSITADSPAQKAEIKTDDVIISIDGIKMTSLTELRNLMNDRFVGDVLDITVIRDKKKVELKLKIDERKKIESNPNNPRVKITTNLGSFTVELFEDEAPNTVANFIELCEKKFYDDIRFHRIIKGFMVQVGCPFAKGKITDRSGSGDAGYKFVDEFSEKLKFNEAGLLAMANSGPNTNGSQIFITTVNDCSWLNGHHAIFGKVIEGMDVVYKIAETPVEKSPNNPQAAKPTKDVYIISTEVLKKRNHEYKVKKLEE